MCFNFGGQQPSQQTSTYVPPAQSAVSGAVNAGSTGTTIKGDNRSGAGVNSRVRAGTDENTAARRRRSASMGLGL